VLGFCLYGLACIAIGIFVSSLTESQVIAAVITFGLLFMGYVMSGLCNMISTTGNFLTRILGAFDMVSRFEGFLNGSLQLSGIVYFLSVIVLFLIFTVQSIQKRRYQVSTGNISMSAYSSSVILLGTALVVLVNFMAGELPADIRTFDVTSNKLYSLTDETNKLLSLIEEDIDIYVLANENQGDSTLDATLQNYSGKNSHIKISYVDPAVNPKFINKYTDTQVSSNSVVVESKKRSRVIDYRDIYQTEFDYSTYSSNVTGYDGEGQITSALAYVISDDMPKIYILEGHGELAFDNEFISAIEKENIEYETINLMNYDMVPEDAVCVVINAPTEDFSKDDADKMLSYMENGGDVLIITTYTGKELTNLDTVLGFYGVKVTKGLVIEENRNNYYQDPFYLLPQIGYDSITESVADSGSYVFAPYAQGIYIEEKEDVSVSSLLSTSQDSYAREAMENSDGYEKQDGDLDGPFEIGVKCEKATGDETSLGVVYSSELLFTQNANEMVAGTNLKLFTGTLGSFAEHPSSFAIPVKSYEISYLTMNQNSIIFLSLLTVIVIPFAFLAGGFVVW
ncbi:MAG: GldG family protein, partial [Lachnospiraceae bacterium]|nr:GldG family protein [Lachnospiraceae bacterium]